MNATLTQRCSPSEECDALALWTDEQLLEAYRDRSDRRAFETLVSRYERELFGYLRQYLGQAEAAEDVFQLTFMQIHQKVDAYDPSREVRPWLYTVATHQAIDYQRRNRRHRQRTVSLDRPSGEGGEDGPLSDWLGSMEIDPADQTENAETFARIRRVVGELPEVTRQAVMLVYFQGMKYREAAEVLMIPVGTVKSRLHGALAKLSEVLVP